MQTIDVKLTLSEAIHKELQAIAKKRNLSLSEVVTEILEVYLEDWIKPSFDKDDKSEKPS